MNHGGKTVAAEPARSDNKRERRRGAAGRAAALRRAPSDSDCSGETASLSADSGDRAPRPVPLAPPRSGKTRSRRRGSEWEVLEGLKDGQRFEKRPDVFNGYLHKKRKWPLKGWHKRFFVVDGGILVYARSPTDVARGRLHGSVDVGLSVISAKARRRRIDIDADEFIYHLRAKTPEVFRTWLNVLKAHRLYRQHLLTFGAREVPKVHPPLEELPPTDNSSHTSSASNNSVETSEIPVPVSKPSIPLPKLPLEIETSEYNNNDHSTIFKWQQDLASISSLVPLNFDKLEESPDFLEQNMFDLKFDEYLYQPDICSMNCMAERFFNDLDKNQAPKSTDIIDAEKQMISTDLNNNTANVTNKIIKSKIEETIRRREVMLKLDHNIDESNSKIKTEYDINHTCQKELLKQKRSPFGHKTKRPTTACFFFTRKKNNSELSVMKKSKKCTNLVKYKNMSDEPPLKSPTSKCMLLGKKTNESNAVKEKKVAETSKERELKFKAVACNAKVILKESNEVQVKIDKENKGSQKTAALDDYDKITEQLMLNIFRQCGNAKDSDVIKFYIDQVVQDLYDVNLNHDMHPVKALFRNLLEYWLKNTSITRFKEAMTNDKSVHQSINRLTKDADVSSFLIKMKSKETQIRELCNVIHKNHNKIDHATATGNSGTRQKNKSKEIKYESKCHSPLPKSHSPRRDTASFEKERRIQELERLLKSTVYMCEMGNSNIHDNKKDIEITKKLINNIGLHPRRNNEIDSSDKPTTEKSNSSAEVPQLQETINHLISETAIPPDVAKEFLGAYLDVLLQESSKTSVTSDSSDWIKNSKELVKCEVVGEAIVKKVSKSVTTLDTLEKGKKDSKVKPTIVTDTDKQIDPGQIYLKDILEKVTTIFSKMIRMENNTVPQNKFKEESMLKEPVQKTIKDELGRPVIKSKYDLIYENCDQNSLVIDLSKYNLEHISMFNDPAIKDMMSITIKLKEKPPSHGEEELTRLSFPISKFSDDIKPITVASVEKCENWVPLTTHDSSSNDIFQKLDSNKMSGMYETEVHKVDLKPYFSNISDRTSKGRQFLRDDSCNSSDAAKTTFGKDFNVEKKGNEETQPCYVMSFKKGAPSSKFQIKKNIVTKQGGDSKENQALNKSIAVDKIDGFSVFEKQTPKIIDEKFILLLLENLSYISTSVSSMHKEINTLYLQFKRKFDKLVKTPNNIQGLSLLGKIYSEDTTRYGKDKETQYELGENAIIEIKKDLKDALTNTNAIRIGERSAFTCTHTPKITNLGVQTEVVNLFPDRTSSSDVTSFESKHSVKAKTIVTEINTTDIHVTEQSTSIPNWSKPMTKETGVNTLISYIFKNAGPRNVPLKPTTLLSLEKDAVKSKKVSKKIREELIKEISLLTPMLKVSTQSQTERQLRLVMDKKEKDYHVHQIFKSKKCGIKASSSVTCASMDVELSDEIRTLYRCSSDPSNCSGVLSPTTPTIRGPQAGFVSGTPGGRFQGWIIESGGPLESAARELGQAQLSVQQLQRLLDALELQHQTHHDTDVSLEGASPNVKKDRRKFGLRKKKSNTKCASVELQPPHIDPSTSHTALSSLSALTAPPSPGGGACSAPNSAASLPIACAAARPQSLPGAETLNTAQGPASITSLTPDHQLREDFTVLAKDLVANLKGIVSTLVCERGRVRAALEAAEAAATPGGAVMAALRTNLTSALQQNSELRTRLSRIHDASDIAEIMSVGNSETVGRQFQQSLSYSSSCVSASEFFDAEEHEDDDLKPDDIIPADEAGVIELDGDSSSEAGSLSSEEGSASSDNSDGAMLSAEQVTLRHSGGGGVARPASCWTRRTRLPAPRPSPGGPSLWNLLYKNIGKDLSQISMPVTINEPLNMLQRLCEELEYSELLDAAAACADAVERAALVAAFAVSAYAASAHRAASKPFNPLLAETYECVREDKGFRFLAEQVSHHPPISACHAESSRWCFWQEARIKTKFWGKSMEFQPTGRVHLRLHTTGDHYTWNKVTTCVHNLFGGQRWVDQYGDMHIVCVGTDIACKLNFVKASSWSHTRHEVRGAVSAASSGARLRLAGRWSEALYAGDPPAARCLWRPGAMPPEHELYYGFTRFAMELNEIEPGMRELLPHTDTRLRPDQRALEEGDVEAAEQYKHQLEQAQRERRRESPAHTPAWFRKTVEEGEETWVFSGEYWKAREAGFSEDVAPRIW